MSDPVSKKSKGQLRPSQEKPTAAPAEKRKRGRQWTGVERKEQIRIAQKVRRGNVKRVDVEYPIEHDDELGAAAAAHTNGKKGWVTDLILRELDVLNGRSQRFTLDLNKKEAVRLARLAKAHPEGLQGWIKELVIRELDKDGE